MMSKSSLSYFNRLFIPTTLAMWAIIITFGVVEYHQEKTSRIESVKDRVDFVNKRIIAAYDMGLDPDPFMDFLVNYFSGSPMSEISLALYDADTGELLHSIGQPLPPIDPDSEEESFMLMKGTDMLRLASQQTGVEADSIAANTILDPYKAFYVSSLRSADGRAVVHAVLPNSQQLSQFLTIDPILWVFVVILALVTTVISFLTSLHVSRNIRLLRRFADEAANDSNFIPVNEFSNDELGQISRQIINIYNGRSQAVIDREHEHRIALRSIEEKSQMKRALTNNINHELKTPVGIIKGYLDTLIENPDLDAESREHFLLKASQNMDRLVELLNNLSTITRLDESGGTVPLEEIDFHQFVTEMAEDFRESGLLGSFTFVYNIPLDCYVKGNQSLLTSVLSNMVKNAVAYSHGSEIALNLVECSDTFYTFSFADNGTGLDEKHFPHLFDRFYRVDSGRARKSGGTGLGLAIVKSAITTMGGNITVRNRTGGGLEYLFTLRRSTLQ